MSPERRDRVGRWRGRSVAGQPRADDAERGVVTGRAVDEDERRTGTAREDTRSASPSGPRCGARRRPRASSPRSAAGARRAAASSRIQVAVGTPGQLGRPAARVALVAEDLRERHRLAGAGRDDQDLARGPDDRRVERHPLDVRLDVGRRRDGEPSSVESNAAEPGKTDRMWPSPPMPSRTRSKTGQPSTAGGPVRAERRRPAAPRTSRRPARPIASPVGNGWRLPAGSGTSTAPPAVPSSVRPMPEQDVVERLDVGERVVARDEAVVAPPDVDVVPRARRPAAAGASGRR